MERNGLIRGCMVNSGKVCFSGAGDNLGVV